MAIYCLVGLLAASPRSDARAARGRGATASQLVDAGLAALAVKDFALAQAKLTEAYKKAPSDRILFHLGMAALGQNHLIEAQDYLQRAIADPDFDESSAEFRQAAEILARPHGPSGEIAVSGDQGALVRVNGRVVGILPLPQPLLIGAGTHTLSIERDGKIVSSLVSVIGGRGVSIRFTLMGSAAVVSIPPAILLTSELPQVPLEIQRKALLAARRSIGRANLAILDTELALAAEPGPRTYLRYLQEGSGSTFRSNLDFVLILRSLAPAARPGPLSRRRRPPRRPLARAGVSSPEGWRSPVAQSWSAPAPMSSP